MRSELDPARAFLRGRFPQGGRVLIAVSGGLDSMCLLHFMTVWGAGEGFTAAAAHFNHRLRDGAADRDERFVRDWCAARGVPFFAGTGDVRAAARRERQSIEEAARNLRYAFLRETAERERCAAILTAHHADDNAETMLLNLIRGTGMKGLAGIPQTRGILCRPFLRIPRETLERYAADHAVPHVEDETNGEDAAARNILRHQVFPVLRELNPRAVENMSHSAGILGREDEAMDRLAAECAERMVVREADRVSITRSALLEVPRPIAERVVLRMLAAAAGRRKDLTAAHVEAVLALADGERTGSETTLPYGLAAQRSGGNLELRRRADLTAAELERDRPLRWGAYTLTLLDRREGEGLSLPAGTEPVRAGPCPPAARLTLAGAKGSRSVKRLCLDRGVTLAEREGLPALYVGDALAAVWRLGVDVKFRTEAAPGRFVRIEKETEEKRHEK